MKKFSFGNKAITPAVSVILLMVAMSVLGATAGYIARGSFLLEVTSADVNSELKTMTFEYSAGGLAGWDGSRNVYPSGSTITETQLDGWTINKYLATVNFPAGTKTVDKREWNLQRFAYSGSWWNPTSWANRNYRKIGINLQDSTITALPPIPSLISEAMTASWSSISDKLSTLASSFDSSDFWNNVTSLFTNPDNLLSKVRTQGWTYFYIIEQPVEIKVDFSEGSQDDEYANRNFVLTGSTTLDASRLGLGEGVELRAYKLLWDMDSVLPAQLKSYFTAFSDIQYIKPGSLQPVASVSFTKNWLGIPEIQYGGILFGSWKLKVEAGADSDDPSIMNWTIRIDDATRVSGDAKYREVTVNLPIVFMAEVTESPIGPVPGPVPLPTPIPTLDLDNFLNMFTDAFHAQSAAWGAWVTELQTATQNFTVPPINLNLLQYPDLPALSFNYSFPQITISSFSIPEVDIPKIQTSAVKYNTAVQAEGIGTSGIALNLLVDIAIIMAVILPLTGVILWYMKRK